MADPVSTNAPARAANGDEFFVGWLKPPRGYVRFLIPVTILLLLLGAGVGVLIALGQRSPGNAAWDTETSQTFEGIAIASPYAMLWVPGDPGRTILLVEEGKFGAAERMRPFDGKAVRVTGSLLHRDERWMLELGTVEPLLEAKAARPAAQPLGSVTLRGEIIDSKCYLGAMKPGGGKTHKACAALCLAGGIPPMFVTREADGKETFYLLTSSDGAAAGELVLPYVGDPVEVNGRLERQGDLLVLKLAPDGVRRR